jgi:hypothetical protein
LRTSGIAGVRVGKRPRMDAQNNHSDRTVKVSDSGPEGPHQRLSADGQEETSPFRLPSAAILDKPDIDHPCR